MARGTKTSQDFLACSAALSLCPTKLVLLNLQLFCWETHVGGQFVASLSSATFATILASQIKKDMKKMQSQRNEALQRLVKHYILISLHSFPQTLSARLFDFVDHKDV